MRRDFRLAASRACRRGIHLGRSIGFCSLLFVACATSFAQTLATVQGRVTDQQGLAVSGADVHILNTVFGTDRSTVSAADGSYWMSGLPAGTYVLKVSKAGFAAQTTSAVEVTVNAILVQNIALTVGMATEVVTVSTEAPLIESETSSSGATILPDQIEQMPINGRNYLDLLQLVPGVAVNRQQDPTRDSATPILGERGGNAVFLIDGMPNTDETNGGAAAQFNQNSVLEFQALTSGYKAEFGHGSGGVINVVTKSGTNAWHGGGSIFYRNYELDSSNISPSDEIVLANPAVPLNTNVPFLLREDYDAQVGGPLIKDKVFFFASAERIRESRDLNFQFQPNLPASLVAFETPFLQHTQTYDTRWRAKLDEQLGRHRLTEQFNLTNTHVTDFQTLLNSNNLPDTRVNTDGSNLMLGITDTAALGNQSNPYILSFYGQYRREPMLVRPSFEPGTPSSYLNLFSSLTTGQTFGDIGEPIAGPGFDQSSLAQRYLSTGTNVSKQFNHHTLKVGWDFQIMRVDGTEANALINQVFGTVSDFEQYGPVDYGVYYLSTQGGNPQDLHVGLRNNYSGLFFQDDWKLRSNLTMNLGLRWDYDSAFPNKANFSPRIGAAWSITPRTVIRANWGIFYDHFRVGIARDIPQFGGANLASNDYFGFPRLFYGNPSNVTQLFAAAGLTPCVSSDETEAQLAGAACPTNPSAPFYGMDYLNNVVAPGHAPVPANAVVDINNVQALTGFAPQAFANAASAAVGESSGYFIFDPLGHLAVGPSEFPLSGIPITVDPGFKTPYTSNLHVGVQQEILSNMVLTFDYYHKDIRNIDGVRFTNLAFQSRLVGAPILTPGTGTQPILSFGPWYRGTYDAVIVGISRRMGKRFSVDASYTLARAIDNLLVANLASDFQTNGIGGASFADGNFGPVDSYVGGVPLVTDPNSGQTNASTSFITSSASFNPGAFVPEAGTHYNGPDIEKGPSDLSPTHCLQAHGLVKLPWNLDVSGIFRAQSGFRYSGSFPGGFSVDQDGSGFANSFDFYTGKNHFTAPPFINVDARIAKRYVFGERRTLSLYFEMFNLLNRANPAAVNSTPPPTPNSVNALLFGQVTQVLPGREGQVGVRFDF
jgi:hypothetical protein